MIRVERQREPRDFDRSVRRPGHALLRVLVGLEAPAGRWRKRTEVATRLEDVEVSHLYQRLWQGRCLAALSEAYDDTCAYLGVRITSAQAPATVDHFVPKSRGAWGRVLAYEWSNYRLSALRPNQRKSTVDILDPFEIETGWFVLDLVLGQIKPAHRLPDALKSRIWATIRALGLDDDLQEAYRLELIQIWEAGLAFTEFTRMAPFVASQIKAQGGSPGRPFTDD